MFVFCFVYFFFFFFLFFFFFNDTATTEIYTLSLHDALPISVGRGAPFFRASRRWFVRVRVSRRSEEHTSELQSHSEIVCRLLLEKKKKKAHHNTTGTRGIPSRTTPPTCTQ